MKRTIQLTRRFQRDLKNGKRRKRSMDAFYAVVERLANDEVLEEAFCDHPLKGNWDGCRECHIQPDWLLIYEKKEDVLTLILQRTGSHRDVF